MSVQGKLAQRWSHVIVICGVGWDASGLLTWSLRVWPLATLHYLWIKTFLMREVIPRLSSSFRSFLPLQRFLLSQQATSPIRHQRVAKTPETAINSVAGGKCTRVSSRLAASFTWASQMQWCLKHRWSRSPSELLKTQKHKVLNHLWWCCIFSPGEAAHLPRIAFVHKQESSHKVSMVDASGCWHWMTFILSCERHTPPMEDLDLLATFECFSTVL